MEKVKFRSLFSDALKKHTAEDAENYSIIGAPQTTPDITEHMPASPKPWLFLRVLATSLAAFFGFYVGLLYFRNPNFLPGLIFFGAFVTPISVLIFFWEINILQNISIYRLTVFLVKGGVVALLYTVTLYALIGTYNSPLLIGFVEETAKLLTILFLVDHRNYKYILNGMLIGAAIGTGFAAFESAGYILVTALEYGIPTMLQTIFWRAVFAPGNHIAWAGIMGAAFIAVKGDRTLRLSMLFNIRFLGMYALVIALHALWYAQLPLLLNTAVPIVPLVLTVLSWVILFALMRRGFRQVYAATAKNEERQPPEEAVE